MCVLSQFGKIVRLYGDQRGLEANLIQLKSIMDSHIPTSRKGVHQLIGRLIAFERFISCFINRLKPFFITPKGAKRAGWNEECDQAFMAIKKYLIEPLILASLKVGDILYFTSWFQKS